MESLMMGVPVVSLECPSLPGRVSASILRAVDMESWVARDIAGYVRLGIGCARAQPRRLSVRTAIEQSVLADKSGVRVVEDIYKRLVALL